MLIKNEEVSQQEFDQVAATAKAQDATVAANRAAVRIRGPHRRTAAGPAGASENPAGAIPDQRARATGHPASQRPVAASQRSKPRRPWWSRRELKLSYTKIVAPAAGIVLKRSAEVGERINAGQQLLMIAQIGDLWVTANFKETQLHNIHPGQSARIHVDALRQDFEGYVETIGGGTGAIASVLPPENATGNYVKVVQRIPVRLRFKPNQNGLDRLRPGMSVEPDVRIGN